MATPIFVKPTNDDLAAADGAYWDAVLTTVVQPPVLDETPVSEVLPYRLMMRVYELHVGNCTQCSEGSLWDQCPRGDLLSQRAADALARQEDKAAQN